MNYTVKNSVDLLDSRDVIARIKELEDDSDRDESDVAELAALTALAEEASGSPDWAHGEVLIRDSYFVKYAMQLADDLGVIDRNATWPLNHIDWDAAADDLKHDYFTVDFDGVDYLIRS